MLILSFVAVAVNYPAMPGTLIAGAFDAARVEFSNPQRMTIKVPHIADVDAHPDHPLRSLIVSKSGIVYEVDEYIDTLRARLIALSDDDLARQYAEYIAIVRAHNERTRYGAF